MSLKITGLDKLENRLKQMQKAAKELEGTQQVPFSELFTTSFMQKYTSFSSFDEFLEAGGFIVNSSEDFEAIPSDVFDKHISSTTNFENWENMLSKATSQFVSRKLGF